MVAGGHTEVTAAVNQPVVAGTLLGEVARGKVVRTGGCRPGDVVLLVGSAGVEGTSIIAREMREVLLEQGWSEGEVTRQPNYLYEPGISVLGPALAAAESGLVTAMHDPTEGGVATGLWELADASGCGLEVELGAVPVTRLTAAACAVFGLDPLGTIASGGLLRRLGRRTWMRCWVCGGGWGERGGYWAGAAGGEGVYVCAMAGGWRCRDSVRMRL